MNAKDYDGKGLEKATDDAGVSAIEQEDGSSLETEITVEDVSSKLGEAKKK